MRAMRAGVADGDGVADKREVLYTGFGAAQAGESQLNSFRWGLDNRIHISTGLDAKQKKYHLARGVGHYGIFNGSKWRTRIAPVVEQWIARHG